MLGDLASDGTIQSIKNASLSLDAETEVIRWDVTICIKRDFILKSIRASPRPSKTQGVPPSNCMVLRALANAIDVGQVQGVWR